MALDVRLVGIDSKPLHTEEYPLYGNDRVLCVTSPEKEHSVWNNIALTTNGTYVLIATPIGDGSLEVLDLAISGDEKAGGSVVVRFNDGTEQEIIQTVYVASRAVAASISFQGKVQGWRAAYIEAAVVGDNFAASVTAVYVKRRKIGKAYATWGAER